MFPESVPGAVRSSGHSPSDRLVVHVAQILRRCTVLGQPLTEGAKPGARKDPGDAALSVRLEHPGHVLQGEQGPDHLVKRSATGIRLLTKSVGLSPSAAG